MSFVDFADLKARVGIEQVLTMLGVALKKSGEQLRGPCPIHGGDNPRAFVVTPSKGLWYCFSGCGGGDVIALVSKVRKLSQKHAANAINEHFGNSTSSRNSTVPGSGKSTIPNPQTSPERPANVLRPLEYLQAEHEAVQALGVTPATCQRFAAGYAPKGIMRGRLAIPIHSRGGVLLAYCGRAVKNESPTLTFPNGFDPGSVIFGCERVKPGPLYLVRDPLQVLTAHESGIENVVAFLTDGITAQQLEQLASLMDEVKCETCELF